MRSALSGTMGTAGAPAVDEERLWTDQRSALEPVRAVLEEAGFYAYRTIDQSSRPVVACDTEAGHVDVRIGADGLVLEVWATSPGLFLEEEDLRRRAALERLARISMPALARGMLGPGQEIWWDEADHGVGARLREELPFAARERLGGIARRRLAELNDLIALVETRLAE